MVSPKERRALRLAEKEEKWSAERQATLDRMGLTQQPKSAIASQSSKQPRLAPHLEREAAKTPKAPELQSRFGERMTWCESRADLDGQWTWGEPRSWTTEEWVEAIKPGLNNLANLTWAEIDGMSSDGGHKMHHTHDLIDLANEAQCRWIEKGLEEFDNVFRFRVGGQMKRAWGFILQAHFHLVWWERNHQIYPVGDD